MRVVVRLAAAVLAPVLCLGAGQAVAPAGAEPQTALIELVRNPDINTSSGLGRAWEVLWWAKDLTCMGKFRAKNIGAFGTLSGNNKGLITIPADKVAYLWMVEDEPGEPEPWVRTRRRCENAGQFIPEAGHSYDAQQSTGGPTCRLSVIDRATHLPPPTYRAFSPKVFCESKN